MLGWASMLTFDLPTTLDAERSNTRLENEHQSYETPSNAHAIRLRSNDALQRAFMRVCLRRLWREL